MPTNVTLAVILEGECIVNQPALGGSDAVKNLDIAIMSHTITEILMVQRTDDTQDTIGDWTLAGLIKRLNDQRQLIEQIQSRLDALRPQSKVMPQRQDEQRIGQLETNLEFALLANKTIADSLVRVRVQLGQLQTEKNELARRLNTALKEQTIHGLTDSATTVSDTIYAILKALRDEANKSSREISQTIHKSREHTARIMKRLCQLGLVANSGTHMPARFVLTEIGNEAINSFIENIRPR